MKKKGFTLIELLAVIVILALIVIIAVPKILDVIEKSERTAWGESAGLMAKAAELKYSEGSITNTERNEIYEFENGDFKSGSPTLTFKGDKPYSGKIVQEKGKTTLALISKNKKWCAIKNTGERIAKVYKIGKEITEENCKIGYTGSSDDKKDDTSSSGGNGESGEETKINYGTKIPSEDTREVLEQATDAKPKNSTIDSSTNKDMGIVMIDSNQNEWVWIEVPSTVFTTAKNSADYDNIKKDLITYANDYRNNNFTDEWYAMDGSTIVTASTEGLTDAQKLLNNGCGLTYHEYNTNYNKMLSSIYTNKGFYIGRYESGIEGSDTNSDLARFERTEITNNSPKTVSKRDTVSYNYVSCSEAQRLASKMSTENKISSLLFGIQWDLVCKFLETKGVSQSKIKEDSTSWGNYAKSTFTINSAKAKKEDPYNKLYFNITGEKTSKVLLTSGASEQNQKMNIYDFAGNVWEWTLEKTTDRSGPCSFRGGNYPNGGSLFPASSRGVGNVTFNSYGVGIRLSLY